MDAVRQTYSKLQEQLIHELSMHRWLIGEYGFVCIRRKRPVSPIYDPTTGDILSDFIWVRGYAKSALALVQRGILVREAPTLYSLTEYGRKILEGEIGYEEQRIGDENE